VAIEPQDAEGQAAGPRCMRCGEALREEDQTAAFRLGAVLVAALGAMFLCAVPAPTRSGLQYAGATAAVLLALMLVPRRSFWRCPGCGARYRRRLPPRGEGRGGRLGDQSCGD